MNQLQTTETLQALIGGQQWDEAEAFCRLQLESNPDAPHCQLNLGQVLLLADLFGDVVRTTDCIDALSAAIDAAPDAADAHFWLGFARFVTGAEQVSDPRGHIRAAFERCLELDPRHPYAHLVMARNIESDPAAIERHLRKVLEVQPGNLSALRQLFDIVVETGQRGEAEMLIRWIESMTYVERRCGIMNDFVNNVFVGGDHRETTLRECQARFSAVFE